MAEFIHWVCLTTGMCQDFHSVLQWRHECRLWWPPWSLIAPRPAGFIRILTHWQPSQLDLCGVSYWLVYVEVAAGWRPEGTSPRTFPKDAPPHPGWESQTNTRALMATLRPWKQQPPWPLTFSSPPRPEAGGKQASHPGRRLKKLPAVLVSHVCDSLTGSMLRKLLTIWEKSQYEFCNRICYEKSFPVMSRSLTGRKKNPSLYCLCLSPELISSPCYCPKRKKKETSIKNQKLYPAQQQPRASGGLRDSYSNSESEAAVLPGVRSYLHFGNCSVLILLSYLKLYTLEINVHRYWSWRTSPLIKTEKVCS